MRLISVGAAAALLGLGLVTGWSAPSPGTIREFAFAHDHILGTSLDLTIAASDPADAEKAERAILDEIERLRPIFSLYDASSELSRLNRTRESMAVSREMLDVLRLYERWQAASHGAFSGQVGELVNVWKQAEKNQTEPAAAVLSEIAHRLRQPGWSIDASAGTVTRLTDQPLNLNAIAKGYIIGKAAEAARLKSPRMSGLLLNLGGDMHAWGTNGQNASWVVGIQNPRAPQDNARPLAAVRLQNAAIATSGGYERYYEIAGRRHSHIFDPRTGRSATGAASATVIAADNATANALATTLCVLAPEEGRDLVATVPGAACLIVANDGSEIRSDNFAAVEHLLPAVAPLAQQQVKDKAAWPGDYQVNLTITLPEAPSKRYRRPYVAAWVEDADAKPVRTITEWGNNPRWIKELPAWWKFAKNDTALVKAVSRATRPPGKHALVWDGKDDHGKPLPQGTYTIQVEVHREHGKLVRQTGKITCSAEPARIVLEKNAETGDTVVEYAKKKAP